MPCEIGGGFGGKIAVYLEPVAALLSRKSGRPVKMTMQRNEVFEGTGPTPGSYIRVKLGAKKDGTLVAGEAWLAYDGGAFPGGVIGPGCMCVFSCYDIPNARVDGYDVVVNKPKTQAYRAPARRRPRSPASRSSTSWPRSSSIDPIEFRLKNAAKEGTRRVDGPGLSARRPGRDASRRRKNSDHWKSHARPARTAAAASPPASGSTSAATSSCSASVNDDGTVTLRRRLDRHRRHAHQHRHAARRDAGHRRRGRPAAGRRHRLRRLHRRDRRQPRDVRHRPGGVQAGPRPPGADERAGRRSSGSASRPRCRSRTASISRNGQSLTFKELAGKISRRPAEPVVGRASGRPGRLDQRLRRRTSPTSRSIPRPAR